MSKLKSKIVVAKVIPTVVLIVIILFLVFAPLFTLEWNAQALGVTEEYYANISFFDWIEGNNTQIHLKNAGDFGIFEGDFDNFSATINIDRDVKTQEETTNQTFPSLIPLLIGAVGLVVLAIYVQRSNKDSEQKGKNLIQLAQANKWDKKTENQFLQRVIGLDPKPWQYIFVYPMIGLAAWLFLSFEAQPNEIFNIGISINFVYFFIGLSILAILQQLLVNSIIKEIKEKKITRNDQIFPGKPAIATVPKATVGISHTSEFFTDTPPATQPPAQPNSAEAENVNTLLEYKKLLDAGIITQEEYDKKKKDLLGL